MKSLFKSVLLWAAVISFIMIVPSTVKAEPVYILIEDGTLMEDLSGNGESQQETAVEIDLNASPTGVEWYEGFTTGIRFDREAGKCYKVQLMREGNLVSTFNIPSVSIAEKCFVPVGIRMDGVSWGIFTVNVYETNSSYVVTSGAATSGEYEYVKPTRQLAAPSGFSWSGTTLSWSAVSGMTGIQYMVDKVDSSNSTGYTYLGEITVANVNNTLDISHFTSQYGEGQYRVRMYAITNVNVKKKSIMAVSALMSYTHSPTDPINPVVQNFVARLYTLVLDRTYDASGLSFWTDALVNKTSDGFKTGYGFVFSDECKNRNLSNSQFVEIMYRTFLDREPDSAGTQTWASMLDCGVDREYVFYGFVLSDEFKAICSNCGINSGDENSVSGFSDILARYRNVNPNVTKFVARCYLKALGRAYDTAGLDSWCKLILENTVTPRNVAANGFFHSDEFINKNTSNGEYVSILYQTFLGRDLDQAGYELWVGLLDRNEWTRDQVLDGFAESDEFATILASFGLSN